MNMIESTKAAGLGRLFLIWLTTWGGAALAQPNPVWTAFNDHYAGAGTGANVTAWNVFGTQSGALGNSGALVDAATGRKLPVILTVNSSGTVGQGSTSGRPAAGTPAYDLFNGYVDWTSGPAPTAPQIYPGAEIDYVFTGLDPERRYAFAGTGIRGGSGGTYPQRWSLIELAGAEAFTPAHTTGAGVYTNGLPASQVAMNTGQNGATGDLAQWDNINPGADGAITIRCAYYGGAIPGGTATGPYGYGLMAIQLQEFNPIPRPAAIVLHPSDVSVWELAPATFQARAEGNPEPVFQWYRDGQAIPGATHSDYTLAGAVLGDDHATFFVVASNWVANASCLATSTVARLTVSADTTPPVQASVLPPANSVLASLQTIEVFFSKPVNGVEAADLLVNGVPATSLEEVTASQYYFKVAQPAPGKVQVAWSSSHGITDTTAAANRFAGGAWTYQLETNSLYAVRINEFMAANKHGIRDEDGDYSDWIELYNASSVAVPLAGCHLTDSGRDLTGWQFPAVALPAKGYLLVWASGKNRVNPAAALHTSFKLNKEGGYLALVLPDGTNILSDFHPSYPAQTTDVSYGRDISDPSAVGFFTTPTPREANRSVGAGFGPEVRFARPSGTFTQPFALELSTTATNAVIRYTFGTNMPQATSPAYTGPIVISSTVQVRARTFVPGLLPGEIQSADYFRLDTATTNVTRFASTLPIMVIHNHGGGDVPMGETAGGYAQFAMLQVFEPKNGLSALTNQPDLAIQCTIHRRGQATRYLPKASLRVETTDEYGGGKSVPLLGYPADNDWVLYGINGYDKVLMHNPLAHGLYRQMGHYSSRTRFVEVFLKDDSGAPGSITAADYNGLYVLEEKIKITPHRVDIDPLQPENNTQPSVTGGYLFSVDKDGPSPGFYAANSSMWYLDPDGPTISTPQRAAQQQYLNNYLNNFYTALTGASWTSPTTGYAAYIDVPAWIDFHLHQVFVFNADMLRISTYWCKPRNGKITPAALWDFDRAFGMYSADGDVRGFNPWRWQSGASDGGTDPFNAGGTYHNPWYSRLFTDPDFWQKWIDRYQELRQTVYSQSNLVAMIDRFGNEVASATPREYARWTGQGSSDTSPNRGAISADGWSYNFPGTWAGQVQFVKTWFANRTTFMDTNFLAPPTVSRPPGPTSAGTALTIAPATEPGSSLLYTLDGTDPRLAGGGISPKALSNAGPATITITGNLRLFARSWNLSHRNQTGLHKPPISSPWSGPTEGSYYLGVPSLRIAEIMYHPAPPPAGNTNDPGNFEYLELVNCSGDALSLAGFRLANAVEFVFTATNRITSLAPGGRVLVVRNQAAFVSRYPQAASLVAGVYTRSLGNGGDHLTLLGPLGELIQDFEYDPAWHPITDGLGFSLVAVDESAALNAWTNQAQWHPSAFNGGSPGAADPGASAIPPVLVNEILANLLPPADDAIELWNPNPTPVDIGYWRLTDDPDRPDKFVIPPGTTLPAGGFTVFYRTNSFGVPGSTNALGQANDAFGLSEEGEAVYLFSGDPAGRLTGYFHKLEFGPSAPGVSCGSHTNSVGRVFPVAQSTPTLGQANARPLIGPVIIDEIQYHPPSLVVGGMVVGNARDEFIELRNTAAESVALFDADHPANTWHMRGGVHYAFPPGVVLPPGGSLLVVGFSPEADPVSLAAFKAFYHLTNQPPIYGPFTGQLNNAGDRVELTRPGSPNPNTQVAPEILVDGVEYGVANPWPSMADGASISLQRLDEAAFGNDPANWFAGPPAPARSQPLEIIVPPESQTVAEESTATFSVAVRGAGPFTWQWYWNGQPLAEATQSSLWLTHVQLAQAGAYSVAVGNGTETVRGGPAQLVVLPLPVITRPPAVVQIEPGDLLRLTVAATGSGTIRYQWQFNGRDLPGATGDALVIENAQPADSGAYRVLVSDAVGTRASQPAQVAVGGPVVQLAVELQASGVVISWPDAPGAWLLEETADLASPIRWQASAINPLLAAGRWQATAPAGSGASRYFRLKRQ